MNDEGVFYYFWLMIDRETVDRILDAADIVDVISDFVTLRRRGANYIACCPFHNEKTPSFSVSPSKGIFKCFGCGKAGSAVTFIMEHEQMTYPEALKYLARKYGIEVHEQEETEEDAQDRLKRESMMAVSEFAAKYYTDMLFGSAEGHSVGLSYFRQKRGFSEETIRKFGLGWSPSGRSFAGEPPVPSLAEAALRAGYKREFLISTGLCYEHGGELVDKFRERVIFPIYSLSGRIIAFGARTLKDDKSVAKYLNSPESEIYHKSSSLYAIYQAKSAIARAQKCYLVEGYADVISMHQAGIENVTASSGTSLTVEQIRLIKRFTNNVTVMYDGDSAGIKAALRGINMLLEEGMTVKVALLPDGHDPDSFARAHTRQEILDFLQEHETDFIEFKYALLSSDIQKDPIQKAELIRDIIDTIAVIPDQITRSLYVEQCAQRLSMKEDMLFSEVARIRRRKIESGEYERRRREEKEARYAVAVEEGDAAVGEFSGADRGAGAGQVSFSPVPVLDLSERELLYYLLKFGECLMTFEDHQKYGAEAPVMEITVNEYISANLSNDDLEFHNPLYRKIYGLYFDFRKELLDAAGETVDITEDKYELKVKEYIKAQIPERNVIDKNVPKAVLVYKLKYVEYTCTQLMESLRQMQQDADAEAQQDVMHRLKLLLQIKNVLVKDLNRVS